MLYRQERSRVGQALLGRAALCQFYQRFELDHGAALAIDYQTLIGLQFNSDLAGFLASWDACLMGMSERPSDKMLWAILNNQLRKCAAIKPVFINIDCFLANSEMRTLKYFCEAANREVPWTGSRSL